MSTNWLTRRTGLAPAPAPAGRLSARSVLDEASRPSAPEPGPEVAFTRRGLAAGQHLAEVHNHYRAELDQVRDLLTRVAKGIIAAGEARGELNGLAIRANNWALGGACQMQCVALAQHHTMEDQAIYPHLRASQDDLAEVLDRLAAEHHAIGELFEEVDAALVHLAGHPDDIGPVSEAIDLLTDTLLSHFAYEERELIGPLARYGFYPGQV